MERLRMNSFFEKKINQMIEIKVRRCIKILKQNKINQQRKRQLGQTIK